MDCATETPNEGHQTGEPNRGHRVFDEAIADRRTRFKQRLIVLRLFSELHAIQSFRRTELHNLYLNVIQIRLDGFNYTICYLNVIQRRLERLNYANDSLDSIQCSLDGRNKHNPLLRVYGRDRQPQIRTRSDLCRDDS